MSLILSSLLLSCDLLLPPATDVDGSDDVVFEVSMEMLDVDVAVVSSCTVVLAPVAPVTIKLGGKLGITPAVVTIGIAAVVATRGNFAASCGRRFGLASCA